MSKTLKNKKAIQLGMNPSTASGRLLKDILFSFAIKLGYDKCYHCNKELTRDTFSIEHKEAWLDSEDPISLFFDLDNIDFSHKSCNSAAGRKPPKKYANAEERKKAAAKRMNDSRNSLSPEERKMRRRDMYLKYGK